MEKNIQINKCSGCSACVNICPQDAISMEYNKEGFLYPKIDTKKCINCNLCSKVCQINQHKITNKIPKEVIAASANDEIREKSSSGGMFGLLAKEVLKQKGYVCGASFSDDFKKVEHIIISNEKELPKLQTSKYIQSDLGQIFKSIKKLLEENKLVLFCATPCQVEGLNNFLIKEYPNLITIDILCHGAPSPLVWREYLNEISKNEKIESINFRDKKNGWSSPLTLNIKFKNKKELSLKSNEDLYYRAFLKNLILRKSCSTCQYTNLSRMGDITLGDFWGINKYNKNLNDNKGLSLVCVNSKKGEMLFSKIKNELKSFSKVPLEYAIRGNLVLEKPCKTHTNRELFFKKFQKRNILNILRESLENIEKYDGIIHNFWYSYSNYGAILTAYAIQQLFLNKGYDFKFLNYTPQINKKRYKDSFAKKFADEYFSLSKEIKTIKDFEKLNEKCEIFVCGSDQILRDGYLQKNYNLSLFPYTNLSKKRYVFSGSFGIEDFKSNEENLAKLQKLFLRFDKITTREKSGVEIFKKYFNIESTNLLDPVFLIEKKYFENLINKNYSKYDNQTIAYILDYSKEKQEKIKTFEEKYKTKVINIARKNIEVKEFLYAIKKLNYFITDSFHGACFAIIFNKNFICLKNIERGSTRFDSISEKFNISNHFVDIENQIELFENDFDWKNIEKIIFDEQKIGNDFIEEIINSKKNITNEQIANEIELLKKPIKISKQKKKFKFIHKDANHLKLNILGIKISLKNRNRSV